MTPIELYPDKIHDKANIETKPENYQSNQKIDQNDQFITILLFIQT